MPAPISAVKKGIKFDSTLGTGVSTNLKLENLTLSSSLASASANSVFIPTGSSTADLMNFNAGGVLITVNPSNQTTSKIVSLIEGKYVDLSLEFDGLGMFRFVVSPGNDQPTVSAWLPEKTEHTIAVSYSISTNILSVSIDGNSTQSIADFSSSDSTANLRVTLAGPASATDGSYDGFIGQLAFFKSEPSLSRLDIMTSNPDVLRTDFANVDLPTLLAGSNDGSKTSFNRQEIQTVSVYGANTLTGSATSTLTFLGSTINLVAADTPATIAGKIVSSLSAIQTATPNVASITNNGAILTITYNSSADDVAETSAVSSSGMTVSSATETVKGIGPSIQQEIQKVVLTNVTADAGTVKFLGIDSAALPKSSTPTTVVTGIVTNKASILAGDAAKALQLVDLTPGPNAGELLLTFSDNAGNVSNVAASATSNGVTFSTGTETQTGSSGIPEKHVISLGGTYKTGDKIAITIPDTVPVTKTYDVKSSDSTTSILAASLVAAFGNQLGSYAIKASSVPEVQKIVVSGTLGVAPFNSITVLGVAIPLASGDTPDKVADRIVSPTYLGLVKTANPTIDHITKSATNELTITYLSSAGDVALPSAVAAVNGILIASGGITEVTKGVVSTLELTGPRSAGNLPDPTITFTTASGLVENNLQDYFDFTKLNLVTSSVQGTLGGTASFTSQTGAPIAVATQDYSGSAVVTPPTGPVSSLPVNGPIYARLKSYTKDSVTSVPKFTYELFVNKSAGLTTLSSVGFTLDFEEAKATFVSFVPAAGTLQEVNTLQAITDGKVSFQWASTAGVTDFSLPVAELTLSLKGTGASYNASTAAPSVGMEISNISVNSTFFKQTGTNLPLVISSPLDAERYTATGTISQVFTATNASTTVAPNLQAGTVVGYEVFGTQTNPAVRLDIRDNYAATKASPVSAQNASVQLDIIANSLPTVGSKFSMVVNLPNNATGATLTAAPGVTLIPAASVLSGTQFRIEGTYAAPAGVTTTTPTLGTIAMTLVREHNAGSDFSISDLTFNGAAAVGRSMYFGLSETNASGVLTMTNLPKGEMVINVFDNPLALTSATSLSSFITIEDARAVMAIASGRNNGALNTATAATSVAWSPSDYIAADWDQNGVVTAADALSMLNYIVSTDKSKTLDYIYIDAVANLNKSLLSATNVALPPVAKVLTHKDIITGDYNFGFGHTDINIVGILVGDLVK